MTERKTIRPVTLRRVVETCSLASKANMVEIATVSKRLNISVSRATEILREVRRMGLLTCLDHSYVPNRRTIDFLDHFEKEQWNGIHEYFLGNYRFYQDFICLLEDHYNEKKGLSMDEIEEESEIRKLSLNRTAIEVLSDWCDRLGAIQRHLYTKRLYLLRSEERDLGTFKDVLLKCYRELSFAYGRREVFVEIPKIREDICEQLKVARIVFDEILRITYLNSLGKIELSGAPITTLAKKSPLSERKMTLEGKQNILSPKFEVGKERTGLLVGRKVYYYLAIHDDL